VTEWYEALLEQVLEPIPTATVERDTHDGILLSYEVSSSLDIMGTPATLREEVLKVMTSFPPLHIGGFVSKCGPLSAIYATFPPHLAPPSTYLHPHT
jgi:hypothetical protein